jgi:hypothetical protein
MKNIMAGRAWWSKIAHFKGIKKQRERVGEDSSLSSILLPILLGPEITL